MNPKTTEWSRILVIGMFHIVFMPIGKMAPGIRVNW